MGSVLARTGKWESGMLDIKRYPYVLSWPDGTHGVNPYLVVARSLAWQTAKVE